MAKNRSVTEDGVEIKVGMEVWLYPANGHRNGPVRKKTVSQVSSTSSIKVADDYYQHIDSRAGVYSTEAAAREAKRRDKLIPSWISIQTKQFHIACTPNLVAYLAFATGIAAENINAHKTEAGNLHVVWSNKKGLQKEKLPVGTYYHLKEKDLEGLVEKMKDSYQPGKVVLE